MSRKKINRLRERFKKGMASSFEKINSLEELVSELRGCERPITETIVHWTAHFNNQGHVGAKEIHQIGLKRGFKGCSYHYIMCRVILK